MTTEDKTSWSRHQCGRRGGFISHSRGTNVAGEVFYMLLGISLFEGNMVASGFESYLVALCFILWEGACTGSYRTRSYDK